jgi:hypothetical protein
MTPSASRTCRPWLAELRLDFLSQRCVLCATLCMCADVKHVRRVCARPRAGSFAGPVKRVACPTTQALTPRLSRISPQVAKRVTWGEPTVVTLTHETPPADDASPPQVAGSIGAGSTPAARQTRSAAYAGGQGASRSQSRAQQQQQHEAHAAARGGVKETEESQGAALAGARPLELATRVASSSLHKCVLTSPCIRFLRITTRQLWTMCASAWMACQAQPLRLLCEPLPPQTWPRIWLMPPFAARCVHTACGRRCWCAPCSLAM